MTPVIYLASPIDQGDASSIQKIAQHQLIDSGCAVFNPAAGWTVPKWAEPSNRLQNGNIALLRQCNGLLAILKPDVLTIGVIMEIMEAHAIGVPVSIYGHGVKPSWSLAQMGYRVHDDLETAIDELLGGFE